MQLFAQMWHLRKIDGAKSGKKLKNVINIFRWLTCFSMSMPNALEIIIETFLSYMTFDDDDDEIKACFRLFVKLRIHRRLTSVLFIRSFSSRVLLKEQDERLS